MKPWRFWGLFLTPLFLIAQPAGEYPLHIGDQWEYSDLHGGVWRVFTTGDTTLPNGESYFIASGALLRQSGDRVFLYNPEINDELTLYDFGAEVDEVVSEYVWSPGDTFRVTLTGKGSKSVFGRIRQYWRFFQDYSTVATDDGSILEIVDGLGLFSVDTPLDPDYVLRGAIIDSVQYGTITGFVSANDPELLAFDLQQNYPNPFNPSTRIRYELARGASIDLAVYDTQGRLVKKLTGGNKAAGRYEVEWDGRNTAGSPVGSGVYFARLGTENSQQVRKMLLVR